MKASSGCSQSSHPLTQALTRLCPELPAASWPGAGSPSEKAVTNCKDIFSPAPQLYMPAEPEFFWHRISDLCSTLLGLETSIPARVGTFDPVLHPLPPTNQQHLYLPEREEHFWPGGVQASWEIQNDRTVLYFLGASLILKDLNSIFILIHIYLIIKLNLLQRKHVVLQVHRKTI